VHDALPARGARDTRWLAHESGVPPDAIRSALTELERRGLARCRDGLWELAEPGGGA
jgi:DNA processing protein